MPTRPHNTVLSGLSISDDELLIGGQRVSRLAMQVGQTPFYAYDRDAVVRRVHDLRNAMPPNLSIYYAVKANPMPALVSLMNTLVDGLDVASAGEMRVALDTGMEATEISFAGPGKRDDELAAAIAAGVTINLESSNELERAWRIGAALNAQPIVAIRVNPDFELKSSGMKMAGGPKPFGIDAEIVPDVLARIQELDLHFRGFHIFSGSQNLRAESLVETQCATFELAYRLAESVPQDIELLNIGGGYGIPYFPKDEALELQTVGDNLERCMNDCRQRLGNTEIVLELGRYLVGEAGYYVCKVIDKKVSRGQTYLVTDGGLHHHLAASGNFGQVIRKNFPVVNGKGVFASLREQVNVVGPLCTPLDLLADKMELGTAQVGDLIVVLQSGAYGYSASPHRFLSHPEPVEVLV
jgi:diaminopimelate decarboxylase